MNAPPAASTENPSRGAATLWMAKEFARAADGVLLVALLAWIYQTLESAAIAAILVLALRLPRLLLAPSAGRWRDRWRARGVLTTAQSLRIVALLPLFWVRTPDDLPLLLAAASLSSLPSAPLEAAWRALRPSRRPGEAVSLPGPLFPQTASLGGVVGCAAAASLYGGWGISGSALAVVALLLLSTASLQISPPVGQHRKHQQEPAREAGELRQGLRFLLACPPLRTVALVSVASALPLGGLVVVLQALTVETLLISPESVGMILAALGLGTLLALAARRHARGFLTPGAQLATALGLLASGTFGLTLSTGLPGTLLFAGIAGVGGGLMASTLTSRITLLIDEEARWCVPVLLSLTVEAGLLLSAAALGPLADLLRPPLTLTLISISLWVVSLYAFGAVPDGAVSEGCR